MNVALNLEQEKLRDKILGINRSTYLYGLSQFEVLSLDGLNELIDNNFIELNSSFNYSPKVKDFFDFMVKYPDFKCFGHATRRADDYYVTITGIEGYNVEDKDAIIDFCNTFRLADEFCAAKEHCRAWYD